MNSEARPWLRLLLLIPIAFALLLIAVPAGCGLLLFANGELSSPLSIENLDNLLMIAVLVAGPATFGCGILLLVAHAWRKLSLPAAQPPAPHADVAPDDAAAPEDGPAPPTA